jgi:CDP-paratose 2-epimerase
MRILVTGGAGFIGSHVAEYYARKAERVIVFDNLSRATILGKFIGDPLYNFYYLKNNYANIELVKGDVCNFDEIKKMSSGVDVIVHAAAQVAMTTSLSNPRIDFKINVLGTINVLEAARLNDATVIFCSTNKVYGENVNKVPVYERKNRYCFTDARYKKGIPESFPIDLCGHSPYGCSKLAGDLYVQDYAHTYGLKTGVFRMSCIYGERQFGVEDQGWIAWFAIATLTDRVITIYGDGKQVRDVLYVSDLVDSFDFFINSSLKHGVFNIGGGLKNTLSVLELLHLLANLTGKKPRFSFTSWRPADQKVYVSDISKAKRVLKWKPKENPRTGIQKLVYWIESRKGLFK